MANVGAISIDLEPTGYGNYTGDVQVDLVDISGVALSGIVGNGVVNVELCLIAAYAGSHGAVIYEGVVVLGAGKTSYFGNVALNINSVIEAEGMSGFLGSGEIDIDTAISLTAFWSVVATGAIEIDISTVLGIGTGSNSFAGKVLRFKSAVPTMHGYGVVRISASVEASD